MRSASAITRKYAFLLICCVVLFALLAFHELVSEPNAYGTKGAEAAGPRGIAIAELAIYACVPVILLVSWFQIRRRLRPLHEIAREIDAWDPEQGLKLFSAEPDSPEASAVALALARASARLKKSFLEIRDFSLQAAHEIKTPLTILRAQAESEARLAESRGDAGLVARMDAQVAEIDRLARLVDGLGLLAKTDAGMVAFRLAPARLDELVMDFLEDIRVLAEPAGIVVTAKIGRPVLARFDRQRMRQVFLALAENAVKFSRPGGEITMGASEVKGRAQLWIENESATLVPTEARKVFDPFFRGSRSKTDTEGSGLGLSIARALVEAQGGLISYQIVSPDRVSVAILLPALPVPSGIASRQPSPIPDSVGAGI